LVTVPNGAFQPDHTAALENATDQRWSYQTTRQPVLKGTEGLSYDAPMSRWVPASHEVFSADGSDYAWTERNPSTTSNRLHLTKVADGSDKSWAVPPPNDPIFRGHGPMLPVPLAITPGGILLTYGWEGTYGVWRLDPASGLLAKVSGEPAARGYGAGALWLEPLRGSATVGAEQSGDTLARLDPASGAVEDWFRRDGTLVRYLGVDKDGDPWVVTWVYASQAFEIGIWRVSGPGHSDLILAGQQFSRTFSDGHGTWFGNDSGVYLFASGSVERVSSASVGEVLGPCIT